ncbi:HAD family hydrolase [Terasakiella sp. A23]|uniref:HAD family hydrolase n=1 Tax=Terasakiella sp. FCG-A23 TaxID=3080561 RepID=UPI00295396BB|nr:HAD family hydrolase [Terasakiella sp. A23]MDV7338601.1 HAD family hydrolase [Terasakiella sp. A23]
MTKPSRPKALLFDWDNTLVDTWPAIHDAHNHTLVAMGKEAWTFEETKQRVRKSMRDSFPALYGDKWEKAGEIFYARFEESHIRELAPYDEAETMLKALYSKGYYLSVVSNKTGKYLREEADHLGWTKYFNKILGAGDAQLDKPDPAPVDLALEGSGIARDSGVWFVGDTDVDLQCAHNSGCVGVLVRNEAPIKGEFDGIAPSWYFNNCMELLATLENCEVWETDQVANAL